MNVYDLYDEQGRVRAFEIENLSISQGAVIKILKSIPGLVVKRSQPWYRFGQEDFCEFELGGSRFEASEQWGDSSRIWLGPSSTSYSDQIDLVKIAFLRHNAPHWVFPLRVLSWILLTLGALAFAASRVIEPSLKRIGVLSFLCGGLVLIATLVVARNFPVLRDGNPTPGGELPPR